MTQDTINLEAHLPAAMRPSLLDRWARKRVLARLGAIQKGSITLVDGGEQFRCGDPTSPLRANVSVDHPRFYRALAFGGALGGAEAYMDGLWSCDDLSAVIRILAAEPDATSGLDAGAARWRRPALAAYHALRRNTRAGSRRNIAAHYDLGNEFFELFLDPTLTYSSGIFERPDASMEEASIAKYQRLCDKLRLSEDDHVLEIGTGWGGFAIHAARNSGCRVTTTTISRRQYEVATKRVAEAGLGDRVKVLFQDYRDLGGSFDKIVSIEMIEAVGHAQLDTFFRVCGERLAPGGVMALQAITIPDVDLEEHLGSVDFIKRYVFPGGELVSLESVNSSAQRSAGFRLSHFEDLTPHYAETLRRWRERMFENIHAIRSLGLDERFLRLWEFYLCYCEGGFDERAIGLAQVVLEKPESRRAPLLGRLS